MNTMTMKRLPSADWLAFGVAMAAVFLKYLEPALMSIIALVVFLPSILREVGVLNDADEWSRGIMHRAGFHAALMAVALLTVNYLAVNLGWFDATPEHRWPFEVEFFRLGVVWIFLVSYVIQYWGAREGVFRILLVVAAMNVAPIMMFARGEHAGAWSTGGWNALFAAGLACGVYIGLAFLVRRWPRAGATTMLALFLASIVGFIVYGLQGGVSIRSWDFASSFMQSGIILGVTALALFHESRGRVAA